MLAQNYTFFYILSFSLIITSFLMIFLTKFSQIIIAAILFFFGTAILYCGFNSLFLAICQIFIFLGAIISMLIIEHKITKKPHEKKYSFLIGRFLAGLFIFITAIILIGMFIYYFSKVPYNSNIITFSNKNELSPLIMFLITAKQVFIDYFLAYGFIIIAFISVLTGISILIPKEKQIENNEGEK